MYFDRTWWGKENRLWVKDALTTGEYLSFVGLLKNDAFFVLSDAMTYPLAGAWTQFLVERDGMSRYLEFYKAAELDAVTAINKVYGDLTSMDVEFQSWAMSASRR